MSGIFPSDQISGNINIATIDIGNWDMDAVALVSIVNDIVDHEKIITVSASINHDEGYTKYDFGSKNGSEGNYSYISWKAGFISLYRSDNGFFDNTGYDSTPFERGIITIFFTD